jgi:hypothetical protein
MYSQHQFRNNNYAAIFSSHSFYPSYRVHFHATDLTKKKRRILEVSNKTIFLLSWHNKMSFVFPMNYSFACPLTLRFPSPVFPYS